MRLEVRLLCQQPVVQRSCKGGFANAACKRKLDHCRCEIYSIR